MEALLDDLNTLDFTLADLVHVPYTYIYISIQRYGFVLLLFFLLLLVLSITMKVPKMRDGILCIAGKLHYRCFNDRCHVWAGVVVCIRSRILTLFPLSCEGVSCTTS